MYVFGLLFYVSPLNLQGLAEGRAERSEERQLSAFGINALARLVVIVLVQFEANEVPLFLDARDGSRSAAHAVVENRVAFVGIGADEVSQQVHRLLGGVELHLPLPILREIQDGLRIACAFVLAAFVLIGL